MNGTFGCGAVTTTAVWSLRSVWQQRPWYWQRLCAMSRWKLCWRGSVKLTMITVNNNHENVIHDCSIKQIARIRHIDWLEQEWKYLRWILDVNIWYENWENNGHNRSVPWELMCNDTWSLTATLTLVPRDTCHGWSNPLQLDLGSPQAPLPAHAQVLLPLRLLSHHLARIKPKHLQSKRHKSESTSHFSGVY